MKKPLVYGRIIIFLLLLVSYPLYAHIKWFSKYSFEDEPLQLADVTNSVFWILLAASMVVVGLLTLLDKKIEMTNWYKNASTWLSNYGGNSVLIMRVAAAVVLLISWQLDTLIMPELIISSDLLSWAQFLIAVLLLFRVTVPTAGIGIILLYLVAIFKFGLFHMLDYFLIAGIGYFLLVSNAVNPKLKNTGLLMLYMSLGFSLCWAGMEKLIYPHWGVYLLELYPILSLGLGEKLFVQGAAFIEISVGVMFIFCYIHRILAVVVTLLFFLTTLVFGKTEIIGHLFIHASLIIFLIEGSGNIFKTLPPLYRRFGRNPIFAGLGFAILFFAFLIPYTHGANQKYNKAMQAQLDSHPHNIEISDPDIAPQVTMLVNEDQIEGWNIEIKTQNFVFKPPKDTKVLPQEDEGYAIISIDNEEIARLYNPWYYLPPLDPGTYDIEVRLYSANHAQFIHLGLPIQANHEIVSE